MPTLTAAPPRERTERALGRYVDEDGAKRTILAIKGVGRTTLVIDRREGACADMRLVAHLGSDEPASNARLVARLYQEAEPSWRRCRLLRLEDLHNEALHPEPTITSPATVLADAEGCSYRLAVVRATRAGRRTRELRWTRFREGGPHEVMCLRDVIGALESYEPARTMTLAAITRFGKLEERPALATIRGELNRLEESSTVLNRGLREAVTRTVEGGLVTLSDIAAHCERFHDGAGRIGDTSWLQRRIGVMAEAQAERPTPWISYPVLGEIARRGLGIDPASVEL